MRTLRKYLFWLFAISFLVSVAITVSSLLRILNSRGPVRVSYLLVPAVFSVPTVTYAMACWSGIKGKPSARIWGMAASMTYLVLAAWLAREGSRLGLDNLLVSGMGIAGLLAFARPYEQPATAERARANASITGDGTSSLLNKFAEFLLFLAALGIYWWWLWWRGANGIAVEHPGWQRWAMYAAVVLVVTTMHEAGHATTGLALGMKLRAFVVGPLEWRVREGKWRFQFNPQKILSGDGATGIVPPGRDYSVRKQLCMLAAGSSVNILSGALALWMVLGARPESPIQLGGTTALFAAWSLFLGSANLIPFRAGDYYSDGAIIYQLQGGGPWGDFHQVTAAVGSSLVTALRPRDYDIDAILRAARTVTQGKPGLILQLHAYAYFLDQGKMAEAGEALVKAQSVLRQSALEIPADLHTLFVFGNGWVRRDAAAAREWWIRMQAKKPVLANADYWRALSALYWIEGEVKAANEAWAKAHTLAQQLPAAGAYEFDRYCCSLLRQALDEGSAGAAAGAAQGATEPREPVAE